jgi:hypothetical protein
MAETPQPVPRSDVIATRVEIPPDEFRRMLNEAWRNEISAELWGRIRWLAAGISAATAGILSVVGAVVWALLVNQVEREVQKVSDQARTQMEGQVMRTARSAADQAIKDDLTSVEQVRERVRQSVGPVMEEAVRDPAIVAQIRRNAESAIQAQLADVAVRRDIERRLMVRQAADATLAPQLRLFALNGLLRDAEGRDVAVRVLAESAQRIPPGGLGGRSDEAQFVVQGVAEYVEQASRDRGASGLDGFAAHEALLRYLIAAAPGRPGNSFEQLIHRFSSPAAMRWLVARVRDGDQARRSLALQALLTHPAPEARERVEGLLCGMDPQMRLDTLRAASRRPDALQGDPAGEAFVQIVRCIEEVVAARRIQDVDLGCLPDGSLVVPWRLASLPTDPRVADRVRRERDDLEAQLRQRAETCPLAAAMLQEPGALRRPGGWGTLGAGWPEPENTAALAGLAGLLPGGAEGVPPAWIADFLTGKGVLASASGTSGVSGTQLRPAVAALLLDRLSALSPDLPGVTDARRRLVVALAAAPPLPGRPAERLLLEALGSWGTPACAAALDAFGRTGATAANAPAAVGEALTCLRVQQTLPAEYRAATLKVITAAAAGGGTPARQALAAIAAGLNLTGAEDRPAAQVIEWIAGLPAEADEAEIAKALSAVLAADGLGAFAAVFEKPGRPALDRLQTLLRDRPAAFAPLAAAAPYLDPDFAARIEALPAPHEQGGRNWRVLRGSMAGSYAIEADRAAVVLRLQPLEVLRLERVGGRLETARLPPDSYLVGATRAAAVLRLAQLPQSAEVPGLLARGPAEPLPIGTALYSRLGPDGPRYYPFALAARRNYELRTMHLAPRLDTVITLFDGAGRAVPGGSNDDLAQDVLASRICVSVPEDQVYWLRISNYENAPREPLGFELRVNDVATCP